MMTAMHFRHTLSYDAPPDQVFEMLADPAFREQVSEALDVVSATIGVERTGEGFVFTNDHVQRTTDLPAIARKITGDTTRVIQVEEWPDPQGGSVEIDSPGKPSRISGTVALVPEGEGTSEVVELDLQVKVPVVGGKLERLLADQIREALVVEQRVGAAWLKGDRA